MSEVKILAASIVKFLKQQLESNTLTVDSRESVEVSLQCIESAFDLVPEDATKAVDLVQLLKQHRESSNHPAAEPQPNPEAELLKNEGNELMKAERYREALEKYTRAIEIDPRNAVYFCNRAAAHFKLAQYEDAVADCTAALGIQPNYGKAHGRLGLALSALDRHREACAAYTRAAQLDPDNESYKLNLKMTDERLTQTGERPPLDLGGLLHNPALLNMATEMLSNPNMQNLISGLMSNTTATGGRGAGGSGGMNALLEAGQALAQQMQLANPDLVEQLRRHMRPGDGNPQPPTQ